jgi:hypothetical protein
MWKGCVATAAVLACLAGCRKPDLLQPPPPKDEYKLPPTDDARFLGPPNYPANLLNQDTMRKDKDKDEEETPGRGPGQRVGGQMRGP